MKTTKKILTSLLILTTFAVNAQSKPGCEPSSCGPEDTKVEEAIVITALRGDLQKIIKKMANSNLKFDSEVINLVIQKGESDYESILLMDHAANFVRQELIDKIPKNDLNFELATFKDNPKQTKQEVMKSLQKKVALLSTQMNSI